MPKSIMKPPPQHRIFAATHLATAVLNVNFAVLSVVFIVFERG